MAKYVETATLVISTVSTLTFDTAARLFEVTHQADTTDLVYIRTDGVDPAVADDECDVLLPSERVQFPASAAGGGRKEIRLISAGTPTVTVRVMT